MKHIGLCLVACLLALVPASALAHAHLDRARPAVNATIAATPADVTLWFTEAIEPKFSSIIVQDARGAAMHTGKAEGAPDNTAVLKVRLKPLPPGTYTVMWKILSVDTHRTEGSFVFTVAP